TLTVEITLDEQAEDIDHPMTEMIKLFNPLTIVIGEAKMPDMFTQSINGKLKYSKGEIPFHLFSDTGNYLIQLEGMDKPIQLAAPQDELSTLAMDQIFYEQFKAQG